MAESRDKTCPWYSGRCPIALDERIKGLEKVIEERKQLNEARHITAQKEIQLAKVEADKDIRAITDSLRKLSDTLTPLASAIENMRGSSKWADRVISVAIAALVSGVITFIMAHK